MSLTNNTIFTQVLTKKWTRTFWPSNLNSVRSHVSKLSGPRDLSLRLSPKRRRSQLSPRWLSLGLDLSSWVRPKREMLFSVEASLPNLDKKNEAKHPNQRKRRVFLHRSLKEVEMTVGFQKSTKLNLINQ